MEIKWLIEGDKEKLRDALKKWKEEFDSAMLELSEKKVKTPLGDFPVIMFSIDYEEAKNGFEYKIILPFSVPKILLFGAMRKAKKSLEKYLKSQGIKAKIKSAK